MNLKFNFPHSLSHTSQHQRTIERRWCTQWIRIVSEHKKNMAKGLYSIVNILSLTIASLDNLKGKNLIIGQPGAFTLSCSNHVPWVDEKSAAISLLISRVVQWLSQWIGKTSSKRSGHGIHSRWVGGMSHGLLYNISCLLGYFEITKSCQWYFCDKRMEEAIRFHISPCSLLVRRHRSGELIEKLCSSISLMISHAYFHYSFWPNLGFFSSE